MPTQPQVEANPFASGQQRRIEIDILVNSDAAVAAVLRRNLAPPSAPVGSRKCTLLIAGREALTPWQDPNLQEMHRLGFRGVVFAMAHAGAGGHALHLAGSDHRAGAGRILVFERAVQHIGNDLHVAMAMRRKSGARNDAILVDDAQRTKSHMRRIEIVAERKRVPAVEPTIPFDTAVVA